MKKIYFILVCALTLFSCKKSTTEVKQDPIIVEPPIGLNLIVNADDKLPINPNIFGINNDWSKITNASFPAFASATVAINNQIMRFPGGFESEFYDWNTNTTPGWSKTPTTAGASISTLKANVSNYTIVVPTTIALNQPLNSAAWINAVATLKTTAVNAINLADPTKVKIVEIGNEWWLQFAGGVPRADKLTKYIKTAMNIAEFIDQQFPNRTFKLLINGDYSEPAEFATMKTAFTTAYNTIDGVALHPYTGYNSTDHSITNLEAQIQQCANNFNPAKNFVYASEWAPSKDYNSDKVYMQAANVIPDIIHILARAGVDAGAYWPPINVSIPGLGFYNTTYSVVYPCAQIMNELATSYTGQALKTTSSSVHIAAALNDANTITLFITGSDVASSIVNTKINGFTIGSIQSVKKFRPSNYAETSAASPYVTENATATLDPANNRISFTINSGGLYEIYKIVLKK